MTTDDGFLRRWSRRKLEHAKGDAVADEQQTGPEDSGEKTPAKGEGRPTVPAVPPSTPSETAAPAIDLSKLPSIESITAATDIRGFLAPGVPAELTRAALRRAWVVDPKIRDFIEIAENQWDFTKAGSMPGFGDLADEDVQKLVAAVIGDRKPLAEAHGVEDAKPTSPRSNEEKSTVAAVPPPVALPAGAPPPAVRGDGPSPAEPQPDAPVADEKQIDVAMQHEPAHGEWAKSSPSRRHGGALPK
ncbi:MAG: DUF3306 domain-containing protein [Alphaproteobacteria bacterium]|nr:DUF3306 domain-containing protein [Alphaproteobacteria bacterium]